VTGNQLNHDQQQITTELQLLLRDRIKNNGPLPFSDYMNACLYEPGLGYYVNGLSKLGADGDFVTAPELSSAFAGCVARQTADVLQGESFQSAARRDILEFGAGSGRLACDVLKALDRMRALPDRYLILDVSGQLMGVQQLLISELEPHLVNRVQWIQSLPESFSGVVLANEVFDAFPVERFTIEQSQARRVFVDYIDDSEACDSRNGHFVPTMQADTRVQEVVGEAWLTLCSRG